ncbi:hypothetical protein HAX54_041421, partial [Datura stramonium]|nr:hypothetical protein [Datura stramonium]
DLKPPCDAPGRQSSDGPSTCPSLWGGNSLILVKVDEPNLMGFRVVDFPSHLTVLH